MAVSPAGVGGLGAVIGGDVSLSAGTELGIVVGGAGHELGGGGGSFVFETSVPEPSTWVMMLACFAGLGFAGDRASRKAATAAG